MKNGHSRFSLTITIMPHLCAALVLSIFAFHVGAQDSNRRIKIEALDGRNGTPIRNARLVVFVGSTVEEAREKLQNFDLQTNQSGDAELVLTSNTDRFLQGWVEGMTLCQSRPNAVSLSVEQALDKGLLAPNECGNLRLSSAPGQILVFARPATLREKMDW